ncbi:MAG: methyltransferase domain-containing protein [Bdellovibrionales bacterium]|nr:methyltransferase domain-containing protein [Bdellovibrionales bacterium]
MRHRIQLPMKEYRHVSQSEAFFYLYHPNGEKEQIAFHEYDRIYQSPGLYEQIFYDRLRCKSPSVVTELLYKAHQSVGESFTEMRVLDLGAGNGLMGEALKKYGVARIVGVDIAPIAKEAAFRDRPGIYDDYHIKDFTNLNKEAINEFQEWSFDCLTTVAALGFGDIPVKAFHQAMNLIDENGWIAFNIKEAFLSPSDQSGFSKYIRNLILSEYWEVHFIERYKHRLSMEGVPLFYYAIVARKKSSIPDELTQVE